MLGYVFLWSVFLQVSSAAPPTFAISSKSPAPPVVPLPPPRATPVLPLPSPRGTPVVPLPPPRATPVLPLPSPRGTPVVPLPPPKGTPVVVPIPRPSTPRGAPPSPPPPSRALPSPPPPPMVRAAPPPVPPPPSSGRLGINYGQLADNLPSPQEVAKLISTMTTISKVRIFNSDAGIIKAFANTGIDLIIGVNNDQVSTLATPGGAASWVASNVVAHSPATRITMVTVGNEVLTGNDMRLAGSLLTAMGNVHAALVDAKMDATTKVTTPHSLAILGVSFPPSAAAFRDDTPEIRPLMEFLQQTKAPLLVNAYPYFAYRSSPRDIPLDYALFLPNAGTVDPRTGLVYTNLYAAQVDAVYSAMEKLGFFGVAVAVGESGWPSYGDVDEPGVNMQNAAAYVRNLVSYVNAEAGTPLRPRQTVDTFLFALFNEDLKQGPSSERNYGIFRTDGSLMYDCPGLSKAKASSPQLPLSKNSSFPSGGTAKGASATVEPPRESWCVAKSDADPAALFRALDYACGVADCMAIQNGGLCFFPSDLKSHASYAFNSYYQKFGHNLWNCNFGNTATTTAVDPSYGSCAYLLY